MGAACGAWLSRGRGRGYIVEGGVVIEGRGVVIEGKGAWL